MSADFAVPVQHDEKWDWPLASLNDGVVNVFEDDDKFEVNLEAQNFSPKEIDVKATGSLLEIHLEHTPKKDELGDVSRKIFRCYKLPKGVDITTIKSNLDNNGVLHIKGDKKH